MSSRVMTVQEVIEQKLDYAISQMQNKRDAEVLEKQKKSILAYFNKKYTLLDLIDVYQNTPLVNHFIMCRTFLHNATLIEPAKSYKQHITPDNINKAFSINFDITVDEPDIFNRVKDYIKEHKRLYE